MTDIVFEPSTFYNLVVRCNTADMSKPPQPDNPEPCPHYGKERQVDEVYSNAGQPVVQCWPCGKNAEILSAEKMDPQPEVS
ncbi:hypothetical protein SSOG_09111 [Streptomyces himastatinicus ATCC 53653]|uniref:Uncharacterized protein n=1 Tax=Streptomyces himastatinicus ATCC 53653 TaxID=457427 RepID=D9WWW9_9ACTN|nr:hypothetical protein [Streptomyces himastatinicus]EFL29397.1 hypothetical protein SSOG_09111 [Streptomyces himastatinicus ATCC 53653]